MRDSIEDVIGSTPLVRLRRLGPPGCTMLAKLEYLNPGGSVKDRVVSRMLDEAERLGLLGSSSTRNKVVAASVGNTATALAMLGAVRGLQVTVVVPDSISKTARSLLGAYGAKVVVTPRAAGMPGAISRAESIARHEGAYLLQQFSTGIGADVHAETTAEEIWNDTDGHLDVICCGAGTGATVTGVARALKKRNPGLIVAAVEPLESAVLSGGKPGAHKIYGLGPGFIPEVIDRDLIDVILPVSTFDATLMMGRLAREEGILAGVSSGAVVSAAIRLAGEDQRAKTIVTILADGGWRYLDETLTSVG